MCFYNTKVQRFLIQRSCVFSAERKKHCDSCALLIPCNDLIHNACNIKKKHILANIFLFLLIKVLINFYWSKDLLKYIYVHDTIFAFSVFSPVSHFLLLEASGFVNVSFCVTGSVVFKVNGFWSTEKMTTC